MAKNRLQPTTKPSKKKKTNGEEIVKPSPIDLRKQQVMCTKIAEAMSGTAKELQLQVSGQSSIEGDGEKLIVIFSCFPNGDSMIWFLDKGYYSLSALVNQKRYVTVFPANEAEAFQAELTKLGTAMGH